MERKQALVQVGVFNMRSGEEAETREYDRTNQKHPLKEAFLSILEPRTPDPKTLKKNKTLTPKPCDRTKTRGFHPK